MEIETIARIVVDCGYKVHTEIGPGLLESAYETVLVYKIEQAGLHIVRQYPVPIQYEGLSIGTGFIADLIVENMLIIELKSQEQIAPVHSKQVLTYLRLLNLPLGLLMNFGAATYKEGIRRIVNKHSNTTLSQLRIHQTDNHTIL